jgi:hypothetical protein
MDAASLPGHIRVIDRAIDDQDRDYIARKIGMKLGKFAASVERIAVRLSDANGPKGGLDYLKVRGRPERAAQSIQSIVHQADPARRAIPAAARRASDANFGRQDQRNQKRQESSSTPWRVVVESACLSRIHVLEMAIPACSVDAA